MLITILLVNAVARCLVTIERIIEGNLGSGWSLSPSCSFWFWLSRRRCEHIFCDQRGGCLSIISRQQNPRILSSSP